MSIARLTILCIFCVSCGVLSFFVKPFFTYIVLGSTDSPEAAYSIQYLSIISILFCLHGALMIFRNTLQGMGYSVHAIFSGVGELVGRAIGGWRAVAVLGFVGICLANPLAWGLALCYSATMVFHYLKVRERTEAQSGK